MLQPKEIRFLLVNYNSLKAYLENLNKAIKYERSKSSQGEIIEAMSLTQSISGMPFPPVGNTSDKTADIAQSYEKREKQEIKTMERENLLIQNVLSQLECAISSLNDVSKTVITKHYFNNVRCKDLVNIYGPATEQRDERTIKRIISKSICKIAKLITISRTDYYYISSHERLHI